MSTKQEFIGAQILDYLEEAKVCDVLELPPKASICLARTLNNLEDVAKLLREEVQKIQFKHAPKDQDGNVIFVQGTTNRVDFPNPEEYTKDMNKVLSDKHEVVVYSISNDDIGDLPKMKASQSSILLRLGVLPSE